jgi:hypothetical protein
LKNLAASPDSRGSHFDGDPPTMPPRSSASSTPSSSILATRSAPWCSSASSIRRAGGPLEGYEA